MLRSTSSEEWLQYVQSESELTSPVNQTVRSIKYGTDFRAPYRRERKVVKSAVMSVSTYELGSRWTDFREI